LCLDLHTKRWRELAPQRVGISTLLHLQLEARRRASRHHIQVVFGTTFPSSHPEFWRDGFTPVEFSTIKKTLLAYMSKRSGLGHRYSSSSCANKQRRSPLCQEVPKLVPLIGAHECDSMSGRPILQANSRLTSSRCVRDQEGPDWLSDFHWAASLYGFASDPSDSDWKPLCFIEPHGIYRLGADKIRKRLFVSLYLGRRACFGSVRRSKSRLPRFYSSFSDLNGVHRQRTQAFMGRRTSYDSLTRARTRARCGSKRSMAPGWTSASSRQGCFRYPGGGIRILIQPWQ